jgi:hypothetical protein
LASFGELRRASTFGKLWRAASSGELWQALASFGELRRASASFGELWRAFGSSSSRLTAAGDAAAEATLAELSLLFVGDGEDLWAGLLVGPQRQSWLEVYNRRRPPQDCHATRLTSFNPSSWVLFVRTITPKTPTRRFDGDEDDEIRRRERRRRR